MKAKKSRTMSRKRTSRTPYLSGVVMTPAHPRWREFCNYLGGPEFCDFRLSSPLDPDSWRWTCDSKNKSKPFCRTILTAMGDIDVAASLRYFERHGGHCDCEVLFNVDR